MRKRTLLIFVGFAMLVGFPALAIDDYALAYKRLTELVESTDAPASGDLLIRYDASVPGPVTIDATDLSAVMGISSTVTELDERYFTAYMPNFGSSDTIYLVSPVAGTLTTVYSVVWAAVGEGSSFLTVSVNSVNVSPTTFAILSGSAAGTVDSLTVTDGGAITVGQTISVATDGTGAGTADGLIVFVIDL